MSSRYDVVIVGGGIVGAALALALSPCQLRVAVIESATPEQIASRAEDNRTLVLAYSSRTILETIGAWSVLHPLACLITEIQVSERGQFGTAKIFAHEEGLPALGYVLSAGAVNAALSKLMRQSSYIDVLQPAAFVGLTKDNPVTLKLVADGKQMEVEAGLLVAADGAQSSVRNYFNINVSTQVYQQTAICCNLELSKDHHGIAFERFTQNGPIAILPLQGPRAALVWTVKSQDSQQLLQMTDATFLATLQSQFGYRQGKISGCSKRCAIPLQLKVAMQQVLPNTVLLGNAVHTLHPVAGQGLNLALRDVAILSEELLFAKKSGIALGDIQCLQRYLARRLPEQKRIIQLTHSLITIFSNNLLPLVLARSSGMLLLDRVAWLKKRFTQTTLGLSGAAPRLACGMSLE